MKLNTDSYVPVGDVVVIVVVVAGEVGVHELSESVLHRHGGRGEGDLHQPQHVDTV